MKEAEGARFLYRLAKSARKHWAGLTLVTQARWSSTQRRPGRRHSRPLPSRMAGRTVVFDPSDPAPPPSVGILSGPDPAFAVDSVVSIFHRCFRSSWGPRLDDLLRSACLSLMRAHGSRATLAQVPLLLTDSAFRTRVVGQLTDDLLRGFWAGYDELSPAG